MNPKPTRVIISDVTAVNAFLAKRLMEEVLPQAVKWRWYSLGTEP